MGAVLHGDETYRIPSCFYCWWVILCLVGPFYNQLEGENAECELLGRGRQTYLYLFGNTDTKFLLLWKHHTFISIFLHSKTRVFKKVTGVHMFVIAYLDTSYKLYLKLMGVSHHGICPYYDTEIVTSGLLAS